MKILWMFIQTSKIKYFRMKRPIIQLILIQLREFYREPGILFWAFVFPIAMAWGLGIAFTHKIEQKRNIAYIENQAQPDTQFRKILGKYAKTDSISKSADIKYSIHIGNEKIGYTNLRFMPANWETANKHLKSGSILLIIEEQQGKLLYHYDPFNTEAQLTYLQLSSFVNKGSSEVPEAEIKPLTQKGSRYIDFLIPGLIAMDLMMSTMWGISYSLIEKRSKKLLRRLVATPMKKSSFLFAQLIARLILNIFEAMILFLFANYYFGFTLEGTFITLSILYMAGMLCFTGISILLSSRTSNTYIGNGLINAIVMPMTVLSGIFFSYHNFPDVVIPYIKFLPLTMLTDGLRGIFIEGSGLKEVLTSVLVLSGIGISSFFVGLKMYKWY
jgi:ABC-2 type transport system permease protein